MVRALPLLTIILFKIKKLCQDSNQQSLLQEMGSLPLSYHTVLRARIIRHKKVHPAKRAQAQGAGKVPRLPFASPDLLIRSDLCKLSSWIWVMWSTCNISSQNVRGSNLLGGRHTFFSFNKGFFYAGICISLIWTTNLSQAWWSITGGYKMDFPNINSTE